MKRIQLIASLLSLMASASSAYAQDDQDAGQPLPASLGTLAVSRDLYSYTQTPGPGGLFYVLGISLERSDSARAWSDQFVLTAEVDGAGAAPWIYGPFANASSDELQLAVTCPGSQPNGGGEGGLPYEVLHAGENRVRLGGHLDPRDVAFSEALDVTIDCATAVRVDGFTGVPLTPEQIAEWDQSEPPTYGGDAGAGGPDMPRTTATDSHDTSSSGCSVSAPDQANLAGSVCLGLLTVLARRWSRRRNETTRRKS